MYRLRIAEDARSIWFMVSHAGHSLAKLLEG